MTDEITRGTTISAREMITALVGEWNGTYRLWLEPGELRTEGPTRCTGQSVLEGRFVALDYGWTDGDDPQLGSHASRVHRRGRVGDGVGRYLAHRDVDDVLRGCTRRRGARLVRIDRRALGLADPVRSAAGRWR